MLFKPLFDSFLKIPDAAEALRRLEQSAGVWISGVWGASRAFTAAALISRLRKSAVLVCTDESSALQAYEELRFFLQGFESLSRPGETTTFSVKYPTVLDPGQDPLVFFPQLEHAALDPVHRDQGRTIERLLILRRLARGEPLLMVTALPALLQRLSPPEALLGAAVVLRVGAEHRLEELARALVALGYRREPAVEEVGQFALRGGILDLAAPDCEWGLRVEFEGDRLASLRRFDPGTQKSVPGGELQSFEVMPFQELILDAEARRRGLERIRGSGLKKSIQERLLEQVEVQTHFGGQEWILPFFYPETTLWDYFQSPPLMLLDQPQLWQKTCEALRKEIGEIGRRREEMGLAFTPPELALEDYAGLSRRLEKTACLAFSLLPHSLREFSRLQPLSLTFRALDLRPGDLDRLKEEVAGWMGRKLRLLAACHSRGELLRLQEELGRRGLPAREVTSLADAGEGEIGLLLGKIERGFSSAEAGFALMSDQDLFRREAVAPPRVYRHRYRGLKGGRLDSFADLREGQYAVHRRHGIGIFRGVVRLNIEGFDKDFVCLEYAESEKLYVPVDQVNLVQKYLGGEEHPRLHKLGGQSWQAAQERVRRSVAELAEELLRIYASRELAESPGTGPDTPLQREFEESFPFEETPDQLRAIEEVKRDLESRRPMDRLLCGDVGFGKTEVALRACFKTVMSGAQAAVLVPTTILAQQHFDNFSERLRDFPVRVALLSRFRSPAEQRRTLEELRQGKVDLVVGTHRLLSRDVQFKRLGLVVVDEEQRFGVAHKERLKKLRAQVDVLTMSATPVPRTLHFSLSGLRDMSVIETPPLDRLPVQTYVLEDNPEIMRQAVLRELSRKGQVFFVHNRVRDIDKVAQWLRELVPEASVAVAHGQMPKRELEKVMVEFLGRMYDVLVASTIIESGLDIPNVNTILIHHAEDFGLSQLYQLRGRVGRSERQAYCYLFYPRGRSLSEVAEKRLAAIEEFTELGSGFRVAMRDLEIRGVGNILGPQQHGHVAAVGFDLYCHLLKEAVARLRGEEVPEDRTPTLHLELDAYLPTEYIEDQRQKLDWYKRLTACADFEELREMERELRDRYGPLPRPAAALLEAVEIRLWALELGLCEVSQRRGRLALRYFEDRMPGQDFVQEMLGQFKDKIRFLPGPPPGLVLEVGEHQGLAFLKNLLPQLKRYAKIANSKELAPPG